MTGPRSIAVLGLALLLASSASLPLASAGREAGGPPTFAVTIHETGLKAGVVWAIEIQGSSKSSKNSTLVFEEPPGEYSGLVISPPGYNPNQSVVPISVLDQPVSAYLSFNATSSGIPGGGGGGGGGSTPSSNSSSPGLAPGVLIGILVVVALGVVALLLLMGRRGGGSKEPEHDAESRHARRSAKAAERRSHKEHRRDRGSSSTDRGSSKKRRTDNDNEDEA